MPQGLLLRDLLCLLVGGLPVKASGKGSEISLNVEANKQSCVPARAHHGALRHS